MSLGEIQNVVCAALPGEHLPDTDPLSDRNLALEISLSAGRRFVSLRDFQPDPRMLSYVPLSLAERELLVPLEVEGETLRVAGAFADADLSEVEQRFPNLNVEILVAPYDEVACALDLLGEEIA